MTRVITGMSPGSASIRCRLITRSLTTDEAAALDRYWRVTAAPRHWHGHWFLRPAADGAVLPILHLDGYKIANPAVLARIPDDELDALLRGYGYAPVYVPGDHCKSGGAHAGG